MSAFPKYPKYKPSGVEWLGEVPEHWEVLPGRTCLSLNKDRNGGNTEATVLSLSYGRVVIKPPEKLTGLVPASFEGYQLIQPGDVIIRPTDLQNDTTSLRVGLAKDRGIITSAYLGLRPVRKASSEYLYYLLHAYDLMKVYYGMGTGMRQSLDWRDFKYLRLVLPSPPEQDRIVAFLDEKTAQIDTLIAKKRRQIELLDEQKAILINRAVTRGLNPNAELKDSGIEWIGKIPKHWHLRKLRHVTSRVGDGLHGTPVYEDSSDVAFINGTNLQNGKVVLLADTRKVSAQTLRGQFNEFSDATLFLSINGTLGNAALYGGEKLMLGKSVAFINCTTALKAAYALYLLTSIPYLLHFQRVATGSTILNLSLAALRALPIALPPTTEQSQILDHLKRSTERFDRLRHAIESQIQTLQTLRSTLIAHAVTGKIRI